MKRSYLYIVSLILLTFTLTSCRTSDEAITPATETDGLLKITEAANDSHTIELYSASGQTKLGYNDIILRIKNKATGEYEKNATIQWMPKMQMTSMAHACPHSEVTKKEAGSSLYSGYLVFQMPENETERWSLGITYTINGSAYNVTVPLRVGSQAKKTVTSFVGTDGAKYVVAYIAPATPKVAAQNITLGIWKMQDMMTFPVANGYTIQLDPRMPGMDNHGSPNNVAAAQPQAGGFYQGTINFTMTGYWKINLEMLNAEKTVIKGEPVTAENPASSLYFEVEF